MTRKPLAAALSAAVAAGALLAAPAAYAEPNFTPVATDIVGTGSDTTQFAMDYLIQGATVDGTQYPGYNDGKTAGQGRLVSFDAKAESDQAALSPTIVPKEGAPAINRPINSGGGKTQLYNPSNPAIDYARSSGTLSQTEIDNKLFQVPFAVDGLKLAVDATGTNAPSMITGAQLVSIYKGDITNWNQLPGGKDGAIHALIPNDGSGTRSFFEAQLKALNNNSSVVYGSTVQPPVQEHDPSPIANDPNAIAPFSTGRAKGLTSIKLLDGTGVAQDQGFFAQRALYNVVRQDSLNSTWFSQIFGPGGFICSTNAKPLIEKAGFSQLATAANGGVCGEAITAAPSGSQLKTNDATPVQDTSTALDVTQTSPGNLTMKATVTSAAAGTSSPIGEVTFYEGSDAIGDPVPTSGGQALKSVPGVSPGQHTYTARFVPTDPAAYRPSTSAERTITVTAPAVKQGSKTNATMPKTRFSKGTRAVANVVVKTASGRAAHGKVTVKLGTRKLTTVTLSNAGTKRFRLPKLSAGRKRLVFAYLGNATTKSSSDAIRVRVTRR